MERNTLLAIVLSALVLFGYQAIFVPPKQAELPKKFTKLLQHKVLTQSKSIAQQWQQQIPVETTTSVKKTQITN